MRHTGLFVLCICTAALAGCGRNSDAEVNRALKSVNVIDESNLNDIILRRGLAKSLIRAQRPQEAMRIWAEVVAMPGSTMDDKVDLADSQIRSNEWKAAAATLNTIPPTHETFQRYRLEAMVADSNRDWKKADSFYEIAAGLTTRPGGVYNNWGFSKLTRGDFAGAERLFVDALKFEPGMFTAKNNLVLARGAQRRYDLPVVQMTQTERAQLLHTMALTAIKQGDLRIGKGLLQEAVDTHPQHFDEAVRALRALDANVTN